MKTILILPFFCGLLSATAFCQGLTFDGTDDYIETPIVLSDTAYANWTIECWVLSAPPNSTDGTDGPVYGEQMGIAWNHFPDFMGSAFVQDAMGAYWSASFGLDSSSSSCVHLAATYDGDTLRAYKDGLLMSETGTSGGLYTSTSPLLLGRHPSAAHYFMGTVDDIRIWNVALDQNEIANNMNAEITNSPANLKANYKMNDGVAEGNNTGITNIFNSVSGSNDGLLQNFELMNNGSNFTAGCLNGATSVANITSKSKTIDIYPNPTHHQINFSEPVNVQVSSLMGTLMIVQENVSSIDLSAQAAGIYFVLITDQAGAVLQQTKVVKL